MEPLPHHSDHMSATSPLIPTQVSAGHGSAVSGLEGLGPALLDDCDFSHRRSRTVFVLACGHIEDSTSMTWLPSGELVPSPPLQDTPFYTERDCEDWSKMISTKARTSLSFSIFAAYILCRSCLRCGPWPSYLCPGEMVPHLHQQSPFFPIPRALD